MLAQTRTGPDALLRGAFATAGRATVYVALSGLVGTISFVVCLVGIVSGVPLLLAALAGAPILALVLLFAHLLARFEACRIAAVLEVELPTRSLPQVHGPVAKAFAWLRSRGCWFELAYVLAALPLLGWLGGALTYLAWGGALTGLSFPLWGWAAAATSSAGTPASSSPRWPT